MWIKVRWAGVEPAASCSQSIRLNQTRLPPVYFYAKGINDDVTSYYISLQ